MCCVQYLFLLINNLFSNNTKKYFKYIYYHLHTGSYRIRNNVSIVESMSVVWSFIVIFRPK